MEEKHSEFTDALFDSSDSTPRSLQNFDIIEAKNFDYNNIRSVNFLNNYSDKGCIVTPELEQPEGVNDFGAFVHHSMKNNK